MHQLSTELLGALREGRRISLDGRADLLDAEAAYAVHDDIAAALGWHAEGRPQCWKSGGPARTAALSHAPLAPSGVRHGAVSDFSDLALHAPGAEAEIALRMGVDVTADMAATLSYESAAQLVDAMCVSIELVTSRWQEGAAAPALLRLADFGSHGALALGGWLPFEATRDWSSQTCSLQVNDDEPLPGLGCHSLNDPAWLLPGWLRHATRGGQVLPKGSVVTTGAWLVRLGLRAGDRVTARFSGIGQLSAQL